MMGIDREEELTKEWEEFNSILDALGESTEVYPETLEELQEKYDDIQNFVFKLEGCLTNIQFWKERLEK